MNRSVLNKAIRAWLDAKEITYRKRHDGVFYFEMEGEGRVRLCNAALEAGGNAIQAHFSFPIRAYEDELLDIRTALGTINSALPMGLVHWLADFDIPQWSGGFRIESAESLPELIEALTSYGRAVIEACTDCLGEIIMNGSETMPPLPDLSGPAAALPQGVESLPGEYIERKLEVKRRRLAVEDPEAETPEPFVQSRTVPPDENQNPTYKCYANNHERTHRPYRGNGKDLLVWHSIMSGRLDRMRAELHTTDDAQTVTATLPIMCRQGEQTRLQLFLDGVNEGLRYGAMRLDRQSGRIDYCLSVKARSGNVWAHIVPYCVSQQFLSACSETIVRAMFDHNIDDELLLALSADAIEEANSFCEEEGLIEVVR